MNKLLSVVVSALCAAFVTGTALATDYTWTGEASNNVLTDGGNWSPGLPTASVWSDVGKIDWLSSGTVLSMGTDYTAPKLLISNTSSLQLDLAGHTLTFGNNNNFAWSFFRLRTNGYRFGRRGNERFRERHCRLQSGRQFEADLRRRCVCAVAGADVSGG